VIPGHGKILVVRGGAIGDFIVALPVFAALRRQFPGTHLEVLGYPHIAPLAAAGRLVDTVCSIEARALAGFFARGGGLDERLANYFAGFALIISFLFDPDGIFQENVTRCSKAQFIAGPHRPDEKLNLHATEALLKPLERLSIFDADPVPRLKLVAPASSGQVAQHFCSKATRDSAASEPADKDVGATDRWLALHPGSGSERKNWPEENWICLLQHLHRATKFNFLLVGGEAEGDRLQRLSAVLPTTRIQLAQSLPLVELGWRLQQCAGFIGHDSGISHLAAALGLPGLVLWGETNQAIWCPRGDRITALTSNGGIAGVTVGDVVAEARSRL